MKSRLYLQYKTYCADSGFRNVSKRKFGERLTKLGIEEGRNGSSRFWYIHKVGEFDPFEDEKLQDEENYDDLM